MFKILILACALGMDPSQCDIHTATHVSHGPDAPNTMQCAMLSQIVMAQAAQRVNPHKEYNKVICARPEMVEQSPSRTGVITR